MQLAVYVGMLHTGERTLADSFRQVGRGHAEETDIPHTCQTVAAWSDEHVRKLQPVADRYGELDVAEPERLHAEGLSTTREGPVGLLRDLQDLYLLTSFVQCSWTVVLQAAQGARDHELLEIAEQCMGETDRQLTWLTTRIKQAAPQALLVAS